MISEKEEEDKEQFEKHCSIVVFKMIEVEGTWYQKRPRGCPPSFHYLDLNLSYNAVSCFTGIMGVYIYFVWKKKILRCYFNE